MTKQNIDTRELQKSTDDLEFINQILQKFEVSKQRKNLEFLKPQIIIEALALFFSGLFLFVELAGDNVITRDLYASINNSEIQKVGLANLGVFIALMVLLFYFAAFMSWRKSTLSFSSYLEKNFQYLKRLSLVANLSVKFFSLSLVIISGRIDFVSPMLLVFIFDELYHNRIFNMRFKEGILLGLGALLLAVYILISKESSVGWALGYFFAVSLFSFLKTFKEMRNAGK
ncbi:MAG: hypothetical protein R3A80_01175 [Bdellovibrionota bacterium]